MKKLIIFDLDGTLAESKAALDDEMAILFGKLINTLKVSIISGGDWPQFEKQVISRLPQETSLQNLTILPTCGTKFYEYKDSWTKLYSEDFTDEEKKKIIDALNAAVDQSGYRVQQVWGEQIEDRGSQITYSALGQQAPLDEKKKYDPDFAKRKKIQALLAGTLQGFSVNLGGATSIDITKPGIDKAYGIHKLQDVLQIPIAEMLFIGDALFDGGNDHPARTTGADCIQVRDPNETKRVIEAVIACSN